MRDDGSRALLLSVRGLAKRFPVHRGLFRRRAGEVHALNGVDLDIAPGETLGLVGESGSGKTTAGRAILRLLEPSEGLAFFRSRTVAQAGGPETVDLFQAPPSQLRLLRRDMQIVFQDPYSSLNPRLRIGTNVAEPLRAAGMSRPSRREMVAQLLDDVGLASSLMERFPHELSGGQRQRVAIARALALQPQFIVADEAVSALDVSIQAQVLNLFLELQRARGLAYLFVAHNLAVVRYVSHRIAVMYLGRIVELADTDALFAQPRHPYTEALIDSVPGAEGARAVVQGEPPNPIRPPSGCPFHPRCRYAQPVCATERPPLRQITPASAAACHFAETLDLQGV
ncbi:ABC transporter ATP-binding protein [Alsobacter sp. SYSU M60028]|uniref:ABC transporter ATP-binding protein n=1 Tax=Alsobacter ponti TaxID=2962936 RepID=A0ABT1L9X0_9HYPH|nr:ABC transporter ATP-binding protein [Alsobacter ponti]